MRELTIYQEPVWNDILEMTHSGILQAAGVEGARSRKTNGLLHVADCLVVWLLCRLGSTLGNDQPPRL